MKRTKKVLKIILNVVLWLFVAFAVFVTVLVFSAQSDKNGLASIGGKSLITVQSNSMKPTFKEGDLIIDEVLDTVPAQRDCKVGDVITFYADLDGDGTEEINTHRITRVYETAGILYYNTKGDNPETNANEDINPVSSRNVLGKYTGTRIPFVGSAINFLQTSTGFLCCIVIPLILFFLFELYRFIITIMRVKGKKKISPEEEEEIKRRAIEEYQASLRQETESEPKTDEPSAEEQTPEAVE